MGIRRRISILIVIAFMLPLLTRLPLSSLGCIKLGAVLTTGGRRERKDQRRARTNILIEKEISRTSRQEKRRR